MATQKDIARELGISVSLVSRALSGQGDEIGASEDTVRRIHETAKAMGYVPSAAARSLKGIPTKTIGVVVYDFEDPFFGPMIGHLQRMAHEQVYSLVLAGFERRHVKADDLVVLMKHTLDGLIVVGSEPIAGWATPFIDRNIPIVRIGVGPNEAGVHSVGVDEEDGIRSLLIHLQEHGHKEVGFVGATATAHNRRFSIFRKLVKELKMVHESAWCGASPAGASEAGISACRSLLERSGGHRPSALVASSDLVAIGAIRALEQAGISVPGSMAVTGFDDISLASHVRPSLTTIQQPILDMVGETFRLVVDPPSDNENRLFKPHFVGRESA